MIRLHCLQHVAFEGPDSIAGWATGRGYPITATRLYEGEDFPEQNEFECLDIRGGPVDIYEYSVCPWLTAENRFDTINHRMTARLDSLPLFVTDGPP